MDLNTIQTALELYWDKYERYPTEGHCHDTSIGGYQCGGWPPSFAQDYWADDSDLQNLVSEGFLSRIPVDPINNTSYYYRYEPDAVGQGSPGCQVNTCRWQLSTALETTGTYYVKSAEQGP